MFRNSQRDKLLCYFLWPSDILDVPILRKLKAFSNHTIVTATTFRKFIVIISLYIQITKIQKT